jgi:hypothetical protein
VKIPRDAARPKLEDLMDWAAEIDTLPFIPDEEDVLNSIINTANDFREFIRPLLNPLIASAEEVSIQRFYLRKVEGAEVLLANEHNFLRQELHKWVPVAPEAPPMLEQSLSTRKPRPTKKEKLIKAGITVVESERGRRKDEKSNSSGSSNGKKGSPMDIQPKREHSGSLSGGIRDGRPISNFDTSPVHTSFSHGVTPSGRPTSGYSYAYGSPTTSVSPTFGESFTVTSPDPRTGNGHHIRGASFLSQDRRTNAMFSEAETDLFPVTSVDPISYSNGNLMDLDDDTPGLPKVLGHSQSDPVEADVVGDSMFQDLVNQPSSDDLDPLLAGTGGSVSATIPTTERPGEQSIKDDVVFEM